MRLRIALVLLWTFALVGADPASADVWNFVGSRHQAMGGTGVAFSDDSLANYWNPANLAWSDRWDVQLPVTLNGSIENRALEKLSDLIVTFEELDPLVAQLLACTSGCDSLPELDTAQQQEVADFLVALSEFGEGGEAVHIGAALGLAGRYKSFGFSALSLSTGTVFPSVDFGNLLLGAAEKILACGGGGQPACQAPEDTGLRDRVAASCLSSGQCALTQDQIGQFVWTVEQAGADTSSDNLERIMNGLVAGSGNLASGATGALTAGLSKQEFAFGYGHVLPVPFYDRMHGVTKEVFGYLHEKVAIGIVPKYILGISFIKFFSYDSGTSASGITTSLVDINSSTISHAFGLDLALSLRPVEWLHIGMMARNVNTPSFDIEPFQTPQGRWITKIDVDPQVRIGFAAYPIENLTLALDFDATTNRIVTLPRYSSRIVSLGGEYVIPLGKRGGLALRLGGYSNVSGEVENDWAMTGGLGLRFGGFTLDASAAGSFNKEIIRTGADTTAEFPTRLNLGIGFKWEKQF